MSHHFIAVCVLPTCHWSRRGSWGVVWGLGEEDNPVKLWYTPAVYCYPPVLYLRLFLHPLLPPHRSLVSDAQLRSLFEVLVHLGWVTMPVTKKWGGGTVKQWFPLTHKYVIKLFSFLLVKLCNCKLTYFCTKATSLIFLLSELLLMVITGYHLERVVFFLWSHLLALHQC